MRVLSAPRLPCRVPTTQRYVYVGPTEMGCVHGPLHETPPEQLPPDPLGDQPPPRAAAAKLRRPAKRARTAAAGTKQAAAAAAAKSAPRRRAASAPPPGGDRADAIVIDDDSDGDDGRDEEEDPRPVRPRLPPTLRYPEPRLRPPGPAAKAREAVAGPGECRVVPHFTAMGAKNCDKEGLTVGCRADHPSLRYRPPGCRRLMHLCCGPGGFCMHAPGGAPGGPGAGEGAAGGKDSSGGGAQASAGSNGSGKGGRVAARAEEGAVAKAGPTRAACGTAAGGTAGPGVGAAAVPGGASDQDSTSRVFRMRSGQWLLSQLRGWQGPQHDVELVDAYAVDKDEHAAFTFKVNQRGTIVFRCWLDEFVELVRRWVGGRNGFTHRERICTHAVMCVR